MARQPPTFVVFGADGQVGYELVRELAPLGRVTALTRREADLTDAAAVRNAIVAAAPTVVVNAAAYTAVDAAEEDADTSRLVNGVAPGVMARAAEEVGAAMIHFSTDYVFDGALTRPYTEDDAPNPMSIYGATKLEGEDAVSATNGAYLIFRLSWVYGLRGRNFLRTMLRLAREREELRVVADQYGAPTWSRMVAAATARVLTGVLRAPDGAHAAIGGARGIYHLSAAGSTTWHAFAEAILALDPCVHEQRCRIVRPIGTSEYLTAARRPPCSVLSNDKVAARFGIRLPHWAAQLRQASSS